MEPPKLDFNDFLDIWGRFLPSKSSKTCLLKSTMPKMPKMQKMPKRLKRLKSPTFFKVHRKEHDHKGLFYHRGRGKKGGAAVVPPWGLSIRRPPKVCEACWTTITIACQIRQDQSTKGESERPSSLCRPRFLFPSLFLSPGARGPPEPTTKIIAFYSCWASWADFLLF